MQIACMVVAAGTWMFGGWERGAYVPPTRRQDVRPGTLDIKGSATSYICFASSLVGDTTSAPTCMATADCHCCAVVRHAGRSAGTWCCFSFSSRRRSFSTMGMMNARVLPEPVQASTATSLLPENSGMTASCTGVAWVKDWDRSTSSVSDDSSLNSVKHFRPAICLATESNAQLAPVRSNYTCYVWPRSVRRCVPTRTRAWDDMPRASPHVCACARIARCLAHHRGIEPTHGQPDLSGLWGVTMGVPGQSTSRTVTRSPVHRARVWTSATSSRASVVEISLRRRSNQ
jgi:hypothetical protein